MSEVGVKIINLYPILDKYAITILYVIIFLIPLSNDVKMDINALRIDVRLYWKRNTRYL